MNSRIADSSSISLRSYLVKGTMGTFILLIAATGLGFLTNLILARILGVAEYGAYAFAFSGVGLLTVISMFGMTNILIRNISAYATEEKWGLLRGIKIWALSRGAVSSILMSLFAGLIIWLISDRIDDQLLLVSWIALFAVPLLVVSNLIMSILHGLKRVVLSKVPGTVVRAPFFILLVLLVNKTIFPLKAASAAALNIFSILAALALSWLLLLRSSTRQMRENEPEYDRKGWTSSAIPLLVVDIFNVAMACVPVLALGVIAGAESAGVFSVANVISSIIGFVLIAVNAIIGPVISSFHVKGEMGVLQKLLTKSARAATVSILLPFIALVVLSKELLGLFGGAYQEGGTALIMLCVAQVVNIVSGSGGIALIMTGHERDAATAMGLAAILAVIMNIVLIPVWGINGAAAAAAMSMVAWNIIMVLLVRRRLGLDPTALGLFLNS